MRYGQDLVVVENWSTLQFAEACTLMDMEAEARKRAEFEAKHRKS